MVDDYRTLNIKKKQAAREINPCRLQQPLPAYYFIEPLPGRFLYCRIPEPGADKLP
jgi:hypothetical protein